MTIEELSRKTKAELVVIALADGMARGRTWVLGGPMMMSKDELINYIVRESHIEVTGISQ